MQVHLYSLRHAWSNLRRFSTKGGGGGTLAGGSFAFHIGAGGSFTSAGGGEGGADLGTVGHCASLAIFAIPPPPRTPSTSGHHRTPRVWGAPNGKEAVGKGRRGKEHGREVVPRGARHGSPGPVHGRRRAGVPRGAQWVFWAWARVLLKGGGGPRGVGGWGCGGDLPPSSGDPELLEALKNARENF